MSSSEEKLILDLDLLQKFQSGDREAFKEIYERTYSRIYGIIYRIILNKEESQEIIHDVYIKAFSARKKVDINENFMSWLLKIAYNTAINYVKRKQNFFGKLKDYFHINKKEEPAIDLEKKKEGTQDEIFFKIVAELKPAYRICIVLRYHKDMSYQEIADELGIDLGTVKSRISRAKKELQKLIQKHGYEDLR